MRSWLTVFVTAILMTSLSSIAAVSKSASWDEASTGSPAISRVRSSTTSLPTSSGRSRLRARFTPRQPEWDRDSALAYAEKFYGDENEEDPNDVARKLSQDETWKRITTYGWPDSLRPFQQRFQSGKSYLALYEKIPQRPIDMRSPNRFKNSTSAHEILGKSSIGHMSVGWSCATGLDNAVRSEGFAAQSGESGQVDDMMELGWGLTSAISTFTDGHLHNGVSLQQYFSEEYAAYVESDESPDPYFALVIEVPAAECGQVRSFVQSYVLHPSKPYQNFGMLPDPLKFEGGGCGSFAISALSLAPSLTALTSTFWRTVPIAEKLLGRRTGAYLPNDVIPAVRAPTEALEKTVSKYNLILMNWDSGETALSLHMVDPELSIFSLRKFGEIAAQASPEPLTKYQRENLNLMTRSYYFATRPGHAEGFKDKDHGYQEINEAFSPSFKRVSAAVARLWSQREAFSSAELVNFPFGVGVMIDAR